MSPRIRSIKPEFWVDGKIARLSSNSALFFIALWTHADDYGYFVTDTRELSLKLPRWRSQNILRMLKALHNVSLIRLSQGSGLGQVVGWEHQRIKDRRASKWNGAEIAWDEPELDAPRSAKNRPRRGVDRSGEERSGSSTGVDEPPPAGGSLVPAPKKAKREPVTTATWGAYSDAYLERHKVVPVRNASVNAILARLVGRLGEEEAPLVARFYLTHNDQFYVRNLHPVTLLLRDAEKLRTEWATGRTVTTTQARQVDRMQATSDAFDQAFEMLDGKDGGRGQRL